MYSFLGGPPGACLMFVHPGVKIKSIEGDTGSSHGNFDERRPDVALKDRRADTEIGRCLRRPKQPWEKDRQHVTTSAKP